MVTSTHAQLVGDFFDQISGEYDESITRGCPVYEEMLTALLDHLWMDAERPWRILELGCGTGNLTLLLSKAFPQAHFTVVDLSPEMLNQTRQKVGSALAQRLETVESNFSALTMPENHFDLVTSSIALHHLPDEEKGPLYAAVFRWLKPGGKFRVADQCLTVPADIGNEQNIARWLQMTRALGANEDEIAMWLKHSREQDNYAPVYNHLRWLDNAGFSYPDIYWRRVFWTIYGAEKPAS